jgi:hypothetical protein
MQGTMDRYEHVHKYELVLDVCILHKRIEALETENRQLKTYIAKQVCTCSCHTSKTRQEKWDFYHANKKEVSERFKNAGITHMPWNKVKEETDNMYYLRHM